MREFTVEIMGAPQRVLEGGSGETVLFLHGAGGANWHPLLELMSRTRHVIAPEHPGFGRSALPDWMMSVGDLAFYYLDFLKALDLRDVHLVGHSLGGWTAAEIAIRDTARLRSLALLAPAGVASEVPFGDIFAWSAEEHVRRNFHDLDLVEAKLAALATADLEVMLQNRAAAARLGWSPLLCSLQLPVWLHCIDVPTILVWGEEDRIIPYACHVPYQQGIPAAELFALPASGHSLHTERPREVGARLDTFFAAAGRRT